MLPTAKQLQHREAIAAQHAAAIARQQQAAAAHAAKAQAAAAQRENARQSRLTQRQAGIDARQQRRQAQWNAHHPAAQVPYVLPGGDTTLIPAGTLGSAPAAAGADPYAGFASGGAATATDSAGPVTGAPPVGKSGGSWWSNLSTGGKVGVIGGGIVAVGALVLYGKYRAVTAPVRHVHRILKAVKG